MLARKRTKSVAHADFHYSVQFIVIRNSINSLHQTELLILVINQLDAQNLVLQ